MLALAVCTSVDQCGIVCNSDFVLTASKVEKSRITQVHDTVIFAPALLSTLVSFRNSQYSQTFLASVCSEKKFRKKEKNRAGGI